MDAVQLCCLLAVPNESLGDVRHLIRWLAQTLHGRQLLACTVFIPKTDKTQDMHLPKYGNSSQAFCSCKLLGIAECWQKLLKTGCGPSSRRPGQSLPNLKAQIKPWYAQGYHVGAMTLEIKALQTQNALKERDVAAKQIGH